MFNVKVLVCPQYIVAPISVRTIKLGLDLEINNVVVSVCSYVCSFLSKDPGDRDHSLEIDMWPRSL